MEFLDWGLIDYSESLLRQEALLTEVAEKQSRGFLVFCQHPPVVTLGRGTKTGDLTTWEGPILEVSRGGRATYHGPSQLVIYPIVNLAIPTPGRPAKDIGAFLRCFENSLVSTLKYYGIEAQGRSLQKKSEKDSEGEETGVWVGSKKIASLGIGVRHWITYHGAALNVFHDSQAFQGLKPCGFQPSVMTDMESLVRKSISEINMPELKQILRDSLELI